MNYDDILTGWRQCKNRFAKRRLDTACSVQHEFRGKQYGHPSTYAFVRFECAPAEELAFEMRAVWPAQLGTAYCRLLHDAMSAAIVDVLVAADEAHVGCALICAEIKWDEVASSERAFYLATSAAMTALREQQKWSLMLRGK